MLDYKVGLFSYFYVLFLFVTGILVTAKKEPVPSKSSCIKLGMRNKKNDYKLCSPELCNLFIYSICYAIGIVYNIWSKWLYVNWSVYGVHEVNWKAD